MDDYFQQYQRLPHMDFYEDDVHKKIHETNFWQENMYEVSNKSLSLNIHGHTSYIFGQNRYASRLQQYRRLTPMNSS